MTPPRASLIPALLAPLAAPVPGFPAWGATISAHTAALLTRAVPVHPPEPALRVVPALPAHDVAEELVA
ncbi:hypothetical protein GB931_08145 [Modestobacter sp. I12A-02628]|uniref:Uncharacterized protein n=1 Tax=Goekera deserti TaxID=2497753 RepID=A0A7K3WF14_9ACTN|nr:hypothetical protein [Goekera deserti]MPQ97894.1 hypothetical protein [Goekera deserti]NDI48540.1 hypothetical protein [Goekera deserti]NEL55081.1 hypothetical protein [Goekera deserti]